LTYPPTIPLHVRPPRLALVLGGGGVRSAAAMGVADVLARAGLRPDLVVGCSSGAIFGATTALGLSPEMSLRLTIDLWCQELSERRRWIGYLQLIAPRLARFDQGFSLRSNELIVERLQRAFGHLNIEDLRTPLRIAATDAATGKTVTLSRGSLALAIQASTAVPFVFQAVKFEGHYLMDGVVSDPLPLSAAADAQVIVTLGFRSPMPRRVNRASRLVERASTALMNNLYDARLEAARARGQKLIELELDLPQRFGLRDPAALPTAYLSGGRATLAALPAIERALATAAETRRAS